MKKRSVYLKVWAAALALVVIVGACKDDDKQLPAIDGYNSSDEVSSSNLLAHWSFDDNNNEVISNTAASNNYGSVSSTDGKIGKALRLDQGALVYPPIPAINTANALTSFTVSMWVNVKNTKGAGNNFTSFFGLLAENTDFWGNVQLSAETGRHLPTSDTLELKSDLTTLNPDNSVRGENNIAVFNADPKQGDPGGQPNGQMGQWFLGAKDWVHYVVTFTPSTYRFDLYANGVMSGGYPIRGSAPFDMVMRTPVHAAFGTLAFQDVGFMGDRADWAPMATASIDDVRVYNTVLSQAEITALFNLGTAGR